MKNLLTNMRMLSGLYPETYFAGANTKRGFVSAYPAFIDETVLTRVYVLKGGSGTGKSSLMKKCAERAVANGSSVTMLLCSSDPSSADAVILKGEHGAAAILDGTAPHITDPLFPGAVSEIVNLGEFWRPDALRNARCEITARESAQRTGARIAIFRRTGRSRKRQRRSFPIAFSRKKCTPLQRGFCHRCRKGRLTGRC